MSRSQACCRSNPVQAAHTVLQSIIAHSSCTSARHTASERWARSQSTLCRTPRSTALATVASAQASMDEGILVEPPSFGVVVQKSTTLPVSEKQLTGNEEKNITDVFGVAELRHSQETVERPRSVDSSYRTPSSKRSGVPCLHCKKRRTRCTGQPPACESCSRRSLACSWVNGHELTWQRDLRQILLDQETQLDDLNTLIFGLRTDSDDGATMLLAKLRLGASVEALAKSIRAGNGQDSIFAVNVRGRTDPVR